LLEETDIFPKRQTACLTCLPENTEDNNYQRQRQLIDLYLVIGGLTFVI